MDLFSFCKAHGILVNQMPPIGVWKRYPTEDHPNKRNGAVKFMGDMAFVQNHATDTEVSIWNSDSSIKTDPAKLRAQLHKVDQDRIRLNQEAKAKADSIISNCQLGTHPYLKAKGFEEEEGLIYARDSEKLLVVPMRVAGLIVGCQLIDESGDKKFLYGQRTSLAEFVIDNQGPHILCEGYATGLSVRKVLKHMKRKYTIHVCFSAHNVKKIAESLKPDPIVVIADNDASGTGERIAKEIGAPYWISPVVGEDFNDAHKRQGLLKSGLSLTQLLNMS